MPTRSDRDRLRDLERYIEALERLLEQQRQLRDLLLEKINRSEARFIDRLADWEMRERHERGTR